MSNEMWNFDEFGDLYFEKAVKFLRELFLKLWTESNCVHDVTLVLFSRIYVSLNAKDLQRVDLLSKTVICKDEKGRLYADFYKVLVQNERFTPEEWRRTLTQLLMEFRLFQSELRQYILSTLEGIKYPQDVSLRLPPAREGNVLEALNLTFTLYEEYNIDRNFDRTGKVCVIVTPGSGVFDASRDLISLSKQRSLDLGVTVDLVCLGMQPLHAVPLLVCQDTKKSGFPGESYVVPHWINHSFFRSSREACALKNGEPLSRINVKTRNAFAHRFAGQTESHLHGLADFFTVAASSRASPQPQSRYACAGTINSNFGGGNVGETSHTKAHIKQICELANAAAGKASGTAPVVSCASGTFAMKVAPQSLEQSPHQDTVIPAPQQMRHCPLSIDEGMPAGGHSVSRDSLNGYARSIASDIYNDLDVDKPTAVPVEQSISEDSFGSTPSTRCWSIRRRVESGQRKNTVDGQIYGAVLCDILDPLYQSRMTLGTDWMSLYGYPGSGVHHQLNRYPVAGTNTANRATSGKGCPSVTVSQEMLPQADTIARGLRADDLVAGDRPYKLSLPMSGSQFQPNSVKTDNWLSLQSQYIRAPLHSTVVSNSGGSNNTKTPLAAFKTFPFGIHPHLFGLRRTAGQRRWAHFHAVAYRSHQNTFENSHCLLVLEGEKPCLNLSKVWHAYFDFCRHAFRTLLLQSFSPVPPASADVFFSSELDSVINLPILKSLSSKQSASVRKDVGEIHDNLRRTSITDSSPPGTAAHLSFGAFNRNNLAVGPSINQLSKAPSLIDDEIWLAFREAVKSATLAIEDNIHQQQRQQQSSSSALTPGTVANAAAVPSASSTSGAIATHATAPSSKEMPQRGIQKAIPSSYQVACMAAGISSLEHHQSLLREMLKPIGVDWKSLSTPALLPLTTDFFPEAASLRGECYMVHDYRVVPNTLQEHEWQELYDPQRLPGLFYAHRPLTAHQVLEEMVNQRINQGFQLCVEAAPASHADNLDLPPNSPDRMDGVSGTLSVIRESGSVSSMKPLSISTKLSLIPGRNCLPPSPGLQTEGAGTYSTELTTPTRRAGTAVSVTTGALRHRDSGAVDPVMVAGGGTFSRASSVGLTGKPRHIPKIITTAPPANASATSKNRNPTQSAVNSLCSPILPSARGPPAPPSEAVIFRLSMGSLFHTLTLQPDETITVTKYQARRNQKMDTFSLTYRYALQVPDSLTYYPLEVKFANRISSAFNWSYLDNLVCARGIGDSYGLVSALKFWRSRFMILPAYAATTKRLWESLKEGKASGKHVPCDIYEPPLAVHNYDRLCEKFMHFLESVNRIRRTVPAPKMKPHFSEKPDLPRTRHDSASAGVGSHPGEGVSAAATAATSTNQTLLSSARLQRLLGPLASASSNFFSPSEPTPTAAAGLISESALPDAVFARGTTETPPAPLPPLVSHQHSSSGGSQSSTGSTSFLYSQSSDPTPLSTTSGHGRLMMAILDPESGIPFVTGTPAFPKHTFCSYDLVQWLQRRLVDIVSVSSAVAFAQSLLDAQLMCHASGNPHHRFLFGFFFYTLLVEFVPAGNVADMHEPAHATTKHHPPSAKSSSGSQSSANLPPTSSGRRSAANSDISPTPRGPLVMQIFPFPREFLPQASHALNAFSLDFQKEWIEVLFIRPVPTLHPSNKSTALSTPSFGDNPKASTQRESSPLTPLCPLPLEEEREVASKSMLDGIFSTALLSEVFGAATNANVHVGTEGILRKRHTSIAQESSTQDHCSEWYCLLYDMNYNPTCGFSLEIQWLVASGCRIADSLLHIYRRASNMGFHFFPVPCYPFGYRGTRIILDPLRIPIFVPCSLDHFVDDRELRAQENTASLASPFSPFAVAARLFPNIPDSSAMSAMYEFQSLILSRFGFIPISHYPPVVPSTAPARREDQCPLEGEETPRPAGMLSSQPGCSDSPNLPKGLSFTQRMYVHVSGGMFAMIPTYSHMRPPMRRRVSDCYGSIEVPHLRNGSSVCSCDFGVSSARSYETSMDLEVPMTAVSRSLGTGLMDKPLGIGDPPFSSDSNTHHQQHSLDSRTDCFEAQSQVGFFWTWNHMLPRKWRGQLTGDEAFQDGMLEDFRRFCSGADDRLATLFADYRTRVLASHKKHCSS